MKSKLIVVFAFSLAAGIISYFVGQAFVRRENRVSAPVTVSEPEPEVVEREVVEPVTSYQFGYDKGYRAFMEQQGLEVPVEKMVRYTTLEEGSLDGEAASRGYVDGYHHAGDSLYCPRREYPR